MDSIAKRSASVFLQYRYATMNRGGISRGDRRAGREN